MKENKLSSLQSAKAYNDKGNSYIKETGKVSNAFVRHIRYWDPTRFISTFYGLHWQCAKVDFTAPSEVNCQQETVGCVVVDSQGNCATATSTGGMVNKMVGRIGDTPIIGAGTYANHLCAVSATGKGEAIIRGTVARDVAAVMEYKGSSLEEAADYVIGHCMEKGTAGLVAVSCKGEVTMPFNTSGMFRACATEDGFSEVRILD
eukprot:Gb_08422 [translate_table: standard]